MQRLLIIVGMYRSGSSALTQALHELGYYPGAQEHLRSADEFNSAGYWENSRIMRLNDMLTAQFGLGDFSCQCLPLDWESFPASDLLVDHAAALVRSLYRDQVFAGWKDPRTTRLLPFWHRAFAEAKVDACYLLPVRGPISVASSLSNREAIPTQAGLGLWVHYNLCALRFIGPERLRLISFESLLDGDFSALREALAQFGCVTNGRWERLGEKVQKGLVHDPLPDQSKGPQGLMAERLFTLMSNICVRPVTDYSGEIAKLWEEWEGLISFGLYRHMPPCKITLVGAETCRASISPCQWTTVRLDACAAPAKPFSLSLGDSPGVTYMRLLAAHLVDGQSVPLDWSFGKEGRGEQLGPDLWRFVVYGPGPHILIKGPETSSPWVLQTEVFAQTGRDYAHAAYQGLLEFYHGAQLRDT